MSNRARLNPMDAKATFSALDRLINDQSMSELPVEELALDRIKPNPRQPRDRDSPAFSDESLEELAESIKAHGVLQPILVKNVGRHFQIVAGERRYRACQRIGLPSIPARIVDVRSEEQEIELSLVENLQREGLAPVEEAKIYRQMIEHFGYTYRSLASRIGRSVGYIDTRMKTLAHDDVRDAVQQLNIGIAEARELAKIEDERTRQELIKQVADGSIDRGQLQRAVKESSSREGHNDTGWLYSRLKRSLSQALACLDELDGLEAPIEWEPEMLQALQVISERAGAIVEKAVSADAAGVRDGEPDGDAKKAEAEVGFVGVSDPSVRRGPAPEPLTEEMKEAVDFVKNFRTSSRLGTLELISRYWTALERRGYTFHLGRWSAKPEGQSSWRVFLEFAIDGQQYTAEWVCNPAEGKMVAGNAPARILLGQRA